MAVALSTPGQRIKWLRTAKGWNQETLASKIHTTQVAVSQYENDVHTPHLSIQHLIADAFGVNRSFIFEGDEA